MNIAMNLILHLVTAYIEIDKNILNFAVGQWQ